MRWLALVAALAVATPAVAQDRPTPEVMELNGARGLWFSLPDARRMLERWRLVPQLELRLGALEQAVSNRQLRVVQLREALAISRSQATEVTASLQRSNRRVWIAWVLAAVGIVAGFGIGIAIGR